MHHPTLAALAACLALAAAPGAIAQSDPGKPDPGKPDPGTTATTGNPNLAIATVKLENGTRLSKIIGGGVYADPNNQVGTIDDLIMTGDSKVTMAVVAVGGVLGLGSKLVAVPYEQLKLEGGKTMLPGVTKDSLNAMPNFSYGGG